MRIRLLFILLALTIFSSVSTAAERRSVGPKECAECHEREHDVWKNTPHFESYKKVHKTEEAKKITKALGYKSMKRSEDCVLCHYTKIQKEETDKAKVKSGPSCESCHGQASEWINVHNDFGEGIEKLEDESPEHRKQRFVDAEMGGMISSRMVFKMASSCMRCHSLGNSELSSEALGTMLENEHPLEKDFEIVKYSQGAIRHRFSPPNENENSHLDPAGVSRLYIAGQMAALVASTKVKGKIDNAEFQQTQQSRIDGARNNLGGLTSAVPQLKEFLAEPNETTAEAVVSAMGDKDFSGDVASLLPKEADYK